MTIPYLPALLPNVPRRPQEPVPAVTPAAPGATTPPRKPSLADLFSPEGLPTHPLFRAGAVLVSYGGPDALQKALQAATEASLAREQLAAARLEAERQREQEELRARLRERLQQYAEDPRSLVSAAREAVIGGDIDAAKALLDLAKMQATLEAGPEIKTQVVTNPKTGETVLINMQTGAIITQLYGPTEEQVDPADVLKLKLQVVGEYRQAASAQGYDVDAVLVRQLRDVTPLALQGDSQAQDAFFRALLRLQYPALRRVSDDAVFAQARQEGLLGQIGRDIEALMTGALPREAIANWLPTVNKIVAGRMLLHDALRDTFRTSVRQAGLSDDFIPDYYSAERTRVPGMEPDRARELDNIMRGRRP